MGNESSSEAEPQPIGKYELRGHFCCWNCCTPLAFQAMRCRCCVHTTPEFPWLYVVERFEAMLPEAAAIVNEKMDKCGYLSCVSNDQTMYEAAKALDAGWVPKANALLEQYGFVVFAKAWGDAHWSMGACYANVLEIRIYRKAGFDAELLKGAVAPSQPGVVIE